ncbi:TlpA family protein disulfide reductase [Streptomyces radicis]|uniref:Thioredoxin n=1 Tax=Streptomyces radicis TaxID=1750517 RepID=A0A3A9VSR0_9ACTN|nr:thioredoxin family protein [Streptomyces radicis]RKN03790.1 thioredoxin [Streptomyces radicis]RKN13885.1 thioredoxin [Streptomyces radicis]
MTGLVVCAAVLAAATVFGLLDRRARGRLKRARTPDERRLGADELGGALGGRATFVQFSSAHCAPCRATRRVLAEVAGAVDGVGHIELDAEQRLDLVRELNVVRTPTVLLLDPAGRVVRRAVGQPRKEELLAALADVP